MIKPFGYVKKKKLFSLRGAIVACSKSGDDKAREFIYKQYYGYVMAVVLRYVKNAHDAEELVNESFIKVFAGLRGFKVHENEESLKKMFQGWIARIASNLSIDYLRAKKEITLIDDHNAFESFVTPVNPAVNLEVDDILKMLDELPEIQRLIFNLYEVDGYSHEEIALQLTIPESTSRTYLTRAKKKLREIYQQINDN